MRLQSVFSWRSMTSPKADNWSWSVGLNVAIGASSRRRRMAFSLWIRAR